MRKEEGGEDIVPHLCISFGQVGTGRAVQKALFIIFMGKIDGEGSGGDEDSVIDSEGLPHFMFYSFISIVLQHKQHLFQQCQC